MVSRPPTEDELVERARDGDATAFAALVRDHQEIAFRTAYLITRNAADAEDAAQVGLTKAWRALPRFRRGAPLRPWLLAIVANEARNRRRAEGRREGLVLRAAHELPSGDAAPSPEGRAIAAEERAELLAALERLSDDDRLVLVVPVPARPGRGGDRRGAVVAPRHRQVAHVARARSGCASRWGRAVSELELRLRALRDEIAWPETPPLEPALDRQTAHASRGCARSRSALAILLAVLAGVLALSPGRPQRVPRDLPDPRRDRRAGGEAAGGRRRSALDLGRAGQPRGGRASRRLQARSTWASPTGSTCATTAPRRSSTDRRRSLASCSRELRGGVWDGFVKKVGSTGTRVEQVTVDGERGLFVSGDQHFVMFLDANGAVADERTYLAGTVLLWNRGQLLLRLEGDLTRAEALELAESVELGNRSRAVRCIRIVTTPGGIRMKKLFVLVAALVAALAVAGVAQAGCLATVGLSSTPKAGLDGGRAVGRHDPRAPARRHADVRREAGGQDPQLAPAGCSSSRRRRRPLGSYRARVVFPEAGRYSLGVYDGFPVKECAKSADLQPRGDRRRVRSSPPVPTVA